jgi:hypothetical protein
MKILIKNILATTGLTLITLAIIGTFYRAEMLLISSVYQSLLVNILIHLGLLIVQKMESTYYFVEILWQVVYVLLVLIPSGYLFGWYCATPLWIVVIMGIVIYGFSCFMNIFRTNSDVAFINNQLKHMK